MITRVEFTLDKNQISNRRINIQEIRGLFPDYGVEFTIRTDIGTDTKRLQKQSEAYDHFHLRPWFDKHPNLAPGDKLAIVVDQPMKEYSLEII